MNQTFAVLLVPQKGEESRNLAIHTNIDHLLGGVKVVMGRRAVKGCWNGGQQVHVRDAGAEFLLTYACGRRRWHRPGGPGHRGRPGPGHRDHCNEPD